MVELRTPLPQGLAARLPAPTDLASTPATAPMNRLLAKTLDEVDYGILLLNAEGEALHLNHRARQWLTRQAALDFVDQRIRAIDARDAALLHDALQAATQRGLRRLLEVGRGDARRVAALVPVEAGVAALLLGKSSACEDLSLQCFARSHDLTPAETRVLAALGMGNKPTQIAAAHGVKICTIRCQIGAIRGKTGTNSITALLQLVASLPPMVGALRR